MVSDQFQRRIDRLMDQIEEAADQRDWQRARESSNDVLLELRPKSTLTQASPIYWGGE